MSTTVDGLRIRRELGRREWGIPEPFGPDGWLLASLDGRRRTLIVSASEWDGVEWVHASIAAPDVLPTYDDLCRLHAAVFGDGYAYQVFAPPSQHVNIHQHALHLWGKADGTPVLPNFGFAGSI